MSLTGDRLFTTGEANQFLMVLIVRRKKAIVYRVTDLHLASLLLLLSVCCSAVAVVAEPVGSFVAVTKTVEISLYFKR